MRKILLVNILIFISFGLLSSTTNYFSSSYLNFLEGKPYGVIVYRDGTFSLTTDFKDSVNLPSTPVSSFSLNSVLYVGTTSEAAIFKIENEKVEKITSFDEPIVSSISGDKETLYVGTAPAKIYEVKTNGEKKLLSDLNADIVNSVVLTKSGNIIAAVGKPARLFLISPRGEIKKSVSIPADHARTLISVDDNFFLGTASPASLYSFNEEISPVLLYTFEGEEVTSICPFKNSLIISINSKKDKESGTLAIYSEKSVSLLDKFDTIINSIWSNGEELFIGASNGSIFYFNGKKTGLCRKFDKVVILLSGKGFFPQIIFSSPPSIALPLRNSTAFYNSPIIDLKGISKIGSVKIEPPSFQKVFLRAGNTPIPDDFWTKWVSPDNIDSLPPSRYVQWRIEFNKNSNLFKGLTISAKQLNRPPKIENVKIHPPGEIYVKNVSQIGDRLVQDVHEKERAFPEIAQSRPSDSGTQTYYLYGFRMVSFSVSDPDGDDVRVDIEIKPENSKTSFPLAQNLKDNFFTFDARTLPDGIYTLIITASDAIDNGEENCLKDTFEVPLFEIDNTPPQITLEETSSGVVGFSVKDNSSIKSCRISRNGEIWRIIESDEKKIGSKEAHFTVNLKSEDKWIVFQAVDAYGNMATSSWVRKE